MSRSTQEEVRSAKAHAHAVFSQLADVVGVGITRRGDGYALKVNLRSAPPAGVTLPADVDGVPVEVEIVGTLGKRGPA